jgi:hypothetical protein
MAHQPVRSPMLSCRGPDLVDGDGSVVRLKGVNWFGFNTGTTMVDGLWVGDPVAADFAAVVLRQKLLGKQWMLQHLAKLTFCQPSAFWRCAASVAKRKKIFDCAISKRRRLQRPCCGV